MDQAKKLEIRERFLKLDTSNVADVLDELGYPNQGLAQDFAQQTEGGVLAGWAYTIQGQMTPYPLGGDKEKMTACAGLGEGDISVWAGNGEGICYFGELIAIGMKEKGCKGALADGGIRDTRWIDKQAFPVFARYRTPVQSISRWKVNAWQIPVFLRGACSTWVEVKPGDFILGDSDGAIVVPQAIVQTVLEKTEALTAQEVAIREDLSKGMTLAEALAQYGHV
ncbi:RraA family protein [Alcaligenes endophyticus]|uniref:Putative 4-hydroxy-4-methyl-2-oxoglutarate aldolase n=1 Tax=Alcaligenes endophyticus TaxID=1929088 RepID=A0ABT8EEZ2_9BURK|nr:RraA family protein [Alcaligenes endophyticus]MCX5590477.1 RraA family protein [Alcaligenes endophyticus]MDN4119859.1 RraA family protein [Alcaligenes endophyticus]